MARLVGLAACVLWPAVAYGAGILVLATARRREDLEAMALVPALAVAGVLLAIGGLAAARNRPTRWLAAAAVVENVAFALWIGGDGGFR